MRRITSKQYYYRAAQPQHMYYNQTDLEGIMEGKLVGVKERWEVWYDVANGWEHRAILNWRWGHATIVCLRWGHAEVGGNPLEWVSDALDWQGLIIDLVLWILGVAGQEKRNEQGIWEPNREEESGSTEKEIRHMPPGLLVLSIDPAVECVCDRVQASVCK